MKTVSGQRRSTSGKNDGYHHGDLRAALLKSAEKIIRESGLEALTLRACARRAGVSHGAPAHHFGNVAGLLTELAVEGFDRLTESMSLSTVKDAEDELEATGLGYIRFAMRWPEHFRVMWRGELLNEESPRLQFAQERARQPIHEALMQANAHLGASLSDEELAIRFQTAWCCVHGYASLWVEGHRKSRSLDEAKRMLRNLRPSLVRP